MTDRYELQRAAVDLAAAGLLRAVVVARGGDWVEVGAAEVGGGFHGAVLDSREVSAETLFVGLPGTRVDGRRFAPAALDAGGSALVGPGPDGHVGFSAAAPASGTILVCHDPQLALTRLATCWRRRFDLPVIGVTGSNGKTTTKDLIAALLGEPDVVLATRGNLNSAQGVPVTVLGLASRHRFAAVEMGASAVGHIAARAAVARPRVGVITNAAAAHLEEFGSLDAVISGKGELVAALPAGGTAVLNADSPGYAAWRDRAPCPVVSWGRTAGDHRWSWRAGDAGAAGWLQLDGRQWPVPLPGAHNAANLCAALLACRAVGIADETLAGNLREFRPSAHRGDLRRRGGRWVLDDSYNANPESVRTAVQALLDLPGRDAWAVLGFMAELGPASDDLHRECGAACAASGLPHLVVVGDRAAALADGFRGAGGEATVVADHGAAADLLDAGTVAGDRILIKGSRSAGMETVLAELAARYGWSEETRA